jgi:hypothetical protein
MKPVPLSIKPLYGRKLSASDGEIGRVKDFYFEDQRWTLRYVIVDTGDWLPGRLVLLSPYAIGQLNHGDGCLPVNLTRQQIESSPAIELHRPVSRQYEEAYHAHFHWPAYWNGGGLWGIGQYPSEPPRLEAEEQTPSTPAPSKSDDRNLRSTLAVTGYQIETSDGMIGKITDFIVDNYSWMIRHLVIETGHWFAHNEIIMSPRDVDRVSYEESKIFLKITKEALLNAPETKLPALGSKGDATPANTNAQIGAHHDPALT